VRSPSSSSSSARSVHRLTRCSHGWSTSRGTTTGWPAGEACSSTPGRPPPESPPSVRRSSTRRVRGQCPGRSPRCRRRTRLSTTGGRSRSRASSSSRAGRVTTCGHQPRRDAGPPSRHAVVVRRVAPWQTDLAAVRRQGTHHHGRRAQGVLRAGSELGSRVSGCARSGLVDPPLVSGEST
jgi:hypothetical protein